jgi:hypothetical protein
MKNEREVVVVLTESKINNYKMLAEFFAKKYRGNLNKKS